MGRSPRFGSVRRNSTPISDSLSLRLRLSGLTLPSRYWCTIGHQVVFSLGTWSSRIPTGFLEPRGTQDLHPTSQGIFVYGAFTLFGRPFQAVQLMSWLVTRRPRRDAAQ